MAKINKTVLTGMCFILLTITSACSERQESKTEHVWKEQTDALQSAKDIAEKLEINLEKQQQNLNAQD